MGMWDTKRHSSGEQHLLIVGHSDTNDMGRGQKRGLKTLIYRPQVPKGTNKKKMITILEKKLRNIIHIKL